MTTQVENCTEKNRDIYTFIEESFSSEKSVSPMAINSAKDMCRDLEAICEYMNETSKTLHMTLDHSNNFKDMMLNLQARNKHIRSLADDYYELKDRVKGLEKKNKSLTSKLEKAELQFKSVKGLLVHLDNHVSFR